MIDSIKYDSENKLFSKESIKEVSKDHIKRSIFGGGFAAGTATWGLARLNKEKAQARISNNLMRKNPGMSADEAAQKAKKKKLTRDIALTGASAITGATISGLARKNSLKRLNS